MLQLSVEDVSMKFGELHQLKQNGWKALESPEREVLSPEGPRGPCAAQAEASAGPHSCCGHARRALGSSEGDRCV